MIIYFLIIQKMGNILHQHFTFKQSNWKDANAFNEQIRRMPFWAKHR